MDHLPAATSPRRGGDIERSARQLMAWVSGMVRATGGLAFAAGRFA